MAGLVGLVLAGASFLAGEAFNRSGGSLAVLVLVGFPGGIVLAGFGAFFCFTPPTTKLKALAAIQHRQRGVLKQVSTEREYRKLK